MCFFISAACVGKKISYFLNDLSGVFDRLYNNYLMSKFYRVGNRESFLNFESRILVLGEGRDMLALGEGRATGMPSPE